MKKSREQFILSVHKLLGAMKNNQDDEMFLERVTTLETEFIIYDNLIKERTNIKIQRIQLTENLKKTENSLIEKLKNMNTFIQSIILKKDLKFRDFIQNGKITSVTTSSKGTLLEGAKYFLNGMKNNQSIGIPEKYTLELSKAIDDFELILNESKTIKHKESLSITKLKEKEDDFHSLVKKTISFVKSQIHDRQYHIYFD